MLWIILALVVGFVLGCVVVVAVTRRNSVGIIFITHTDDRTIYSLELDGDPEDLAYRSYVVFKVDTPDEDFDRD